MLVKIIEFLPVIIFFVSYKMTSNLILATTLIVGSCVVATIAEAIITKKLSRMQVFLVFAVLIFGVPTILLKDPSIIKWKVTVVNMILATAIFFFQFILKKNPFALLLGKELPLPDKAFATLSIYWMVFFFFSGMLNIVIAFYLPDLFGITKEYAEELWVDYKTFGNSIINVIFALFTGFVLIKKYPELLKNDNNLNNKK
ncbi:MAG: septation protein IspZ [Succinatimonas sp.]|nr:septation protein IspZ [Succinatimonas sp.]MDD6755191.1 septation protein IspZ [Succinatimonas sp.]MDY6246832.1 septation protein IspZ [Succinivibrio sp.]MDY6260771.1 septation protein IspZ [Succinivibrio sp.]